MQKLTIYDISELAGVSITTVSRVLNGHGNVSQATREKVESVIKNYKYIPRQEARNFQQKELLAVGLLVEDIRHSYMSELAYAVNQELEKMEIEYDSMQLIRCGRRIYQSDG